jgi:hypothetical protein
MRRRIAVLVFVYFSFFLHASLLFTMKPVFVHNVNAEEPTATLKILPVQNTYYRNMTLPETRFTVNATLQNVVNLSAWQVQLEWIPGILNCTAMTVPVTSIFNFIPFGLVIDNVLGTATIGSIQSTATGVSGSDVLCMVEFEILTPGTSHINYSRPYGYDTLLLDSAYQRINASLEDASFEYVSCTALRILPVENVYLSSTTPLGTKFTVNATLENVADLVTWQIKIEWVPGILNCTRVTIPQVSIFDFEEPGYPIIDNVLGTATVGATQLFGAPVNGSDVLCMIEFEILQAGISHVDFSRPYGDETFLLDSTGHDIAASMEDASFKYTSVTAVLRILPIENAYISSTIPAGTKFRVNVTLDNVTNLSAWRVRLVWMPGILNCTGMSIPGSSIFNFDVDVFPEINNAIGKATIASCQLFPIQGANGSDFLCVAEFEILKVGASYINFSRPFGQFTLLLDPSSQAIPFTAEDAQYALVPTPDNAITDISIGKTVVKQNSSTSISVTVRNQDYYLTSVFDVRVYAGSALIAEIMDFTLPDQHSNTLVVNWNTAGFDYGNYAISVVIDAVAGESDISDNTMIGDIIYVIMPFDLTGLDGVPDKRCELRDVAYCCTYFMTTPESPNWDSNCDVTGSDSGVPDNVVDMRDILEVCKHFGEQV